MRITIDTDKRLLLIEGSGAPRALDLYSPQAFEIISNEWLKLGFTQKYSYSFSWFGRPVIQLPEDLMTLQEIFFRVRPTLVIETGVAHGGSLLFFASLCKLQGAGRVIGVDISLRPQNREAIEQHALAPLVSLIEGSSIDPAVAAKVREIVQPQDRVLVFLDSDHSADHVLAELRAYAPLVSPGSYAVVCDSLMREMSGLPGGQSEWLHDNPGAAIERFLAENGEFVREEPARGFDESAVRARASYWSGGWLRRRNGADS